MKMQKWHSVISLVTRRAQSYVNVKMARCEITRDQNGTELFNCKLLFAILWIYPLYEEKVI